MSVVDLLFKKTIDNRVAEQITEVEKRMVEISDKKAMEKATEIVDELEKARADAVEGKSLLYDPFQLLDSLKYKERPMMLTYEVLRAMSERNPIVAAIINTRVNQIASFASPPKTPYDIGFRVHLRDDKLNPTKAEEVRIKELETMVEETAIEVVPGEERDSLDTFLRKITRDSLTYDQMAFEIINGKGGFPVAFMGVDASTIRLASTAKFFKNIRGNLQPQPGVDFVVGSRQQSEVKPEDIRYVQILDGKVVTTYSSQELGFGIRNARSSIKQNGYGVSELEILVNTVTAHLWAEEYNRRFFCFSLGSYVTTKEGIFLLSDLLGKTFKVYNGQKWIDAKAFETGVRPLVRTKLWNGIELETSPEHRFLSIPKDTKTGEPEWKEQKDLVKGDYALISNKEQDFTMNYNLLKVGKKYGLAPEEVSVWIESYEKRVGKRLIRVEGYQMAFTPYDRGKQWSPTKEVVNDHEFWEMIGFSMGDGYLSKATLAIFPHHTREKDILEKFKTVCEKYEIIAEVKTSNPSHKRVTDGEFGYPFLRIGHRGIAEWLLDLGFKPSSESRRIPIIFFQLPSWIRCSLLKGLFSADGTNAGYRWAGTPVVSSRDSQFRQDILKCLWSVGVASNEQGKGWTRGGILVQDIEAFASRIGFLQTQDNSIKSRDNLRRSEQTRYRWDKLHPFLSKSIAEECLNKEVSTVGNNQYKRKEKILDKKDRWLLRKSLGKSAMSRPRAISIMSKLDIEIPWWLESYIQVPIDVLDHKPIRYEPMGDVEVFDDEHIFLCNGVAVHNSQGSAPKGIIHFEGNISQQQLNAFRRQWHAQVMGVFNSWRTPVVAAPAKLQYTNLQMSNKQMEFANWIDYLIKICCAIYLIDPSEIGFEMRGGATPGQTPAFESHQEARQKMSRDRGLRPLLRFIQHEMNRNIIYRIDNGKYEFEFIGLDTKTEEQLQEMRIKEVQNFRTIDEVRAEYDLSPLGHDRGGDVINNSSYLNYINQLAMAKMQEQQMGGEGFGGEGEEIPGEEEAEKEGGEGRLDFGEEPEEEQAKNKQKIGREGLDFGEEGVE